MKLVKLTVIIVLLAALSVAGSAFGQGRGNGNGGGNGGGPGEETTSNNLSVPAIFVPFIEAAPIDFQAELKLFFPIGTFVKPEDLLGQVPYREETFVVDGLYYVQGVHRWQADSFVSELTEPVFAAWGDNIAEGEAKLKTGSPIRVEVGLLANVPPAMTGWNVIKLEDLADRLSYYGTLAEGNAIDGYSSQPVTPYPEVRVYDADAWLTIYNVADPENPIVNEPASAEVNSTGRIVYGYNLRVPNAGLYTIEFYAPNVVIEDSNAQGVRS